VLLRLLPYWWLPRSYSVPHQRLLNKWRHKFLPHRMM